MTKLPRSAAPKQHVVFVENLQQQMLDLKLLRKKVAEAERSLSRLKSHRDLPYRYFRTLH